MIGFILSSPGALVFITQTGATTTTTAFRAPSKEHLPGDDYDCEIQALLAGERVQAAEDIRFNPAGSVPTGVYGYNNYYYYYCYYYCYYYYYYCC